MAAWGYEFYLLELKVSTSLTRSLHSLFQHSKIKFVSPHGHVVSSTYATLKKVFNLSLTVRVDSIFNRMQSKKKNFIWLN